MKFAAPSCTFQGRCARARAGAHAREISSVFCIGFLRGFYTWVSRGKILSVQSEKFFQSGRGKNFHSQGKSFFSLQEKFFQSSEKFFPV